MEKNSEIGEGSYTTEHRQLDARLGRWWSVDPVTKPSLTPYNSMSNNPIWRVDPNGDDDYFDKNGTFIKRVVTYDKDGNESKSNKVFIYTGDENTKPVLITKYRVANENQMKVLASVFNHYYNHVSKEGTKQLSNNTISIGKHTEKGKISMLDSGPAKSAYGQRILEGVFDIRAYLFADNEIHALLSTAENIESSLIHEDLHRELTNQIIGITQGGTKRYKEKDFGGKYGETQPSIQNHLDVHLGEIESEVFKNTTPVFKYSTVNKMKENYIDKIVDPKIRKEYSDKLDKSFKKSTGKTIQEHNRENKTLPQQYETIEENSPRV